MMLPRGIWRIRMCLHDRVDEALLSLVFPASEDGGKGVILAPFDGQCTSGFLATKRRLHGTGRTVHILQLASAHSSAVNGLYFGGRMGFWGGSCCCGCFWDLRLYLYLFFFLLSIPFFSHLLRFWSIFHPLSHAQKFASRIAQHLAVVFGLAARQELDNFVARFGRDNCFFLGHAVSLCSFFGTFVGGERTPRCFASLTFCNSTVGS